MGRRWGRVSRKKKRKGSVEHIGTQNWTQIKNPLSFDLGFAQCPWGRGVRTVQSLTAENAPAHLDQELQAAL